MEKYSILGNSIYHWKIRYLGSFAMEKYVNPWTAQDFWGEDDLEYFFMIFISVIYLIDLLILWSSIDRIDCCLNNCWYIFYVPYLYIKNLWGQVCSFFSTGFSFFACNKIIACITFQNSHFTPLFSQPPSRSLSLL